MIATAAAWLVAPGTSALAAAACAPADPFQRVTLTPATYFASARFGAVSVTADLNGDRFADLAVGAPGDAVGALAAGTVSVYYGSAAGLGTPRRISQNNVTGAGPENGDRFGAALAAGDVTGDGRTDLVIGSPGEADGTKANSGAVVLFRGAASGLEATGTAYWQTAFGGASEAGDQFGGALTAGNFAGDGRAELAIGAPGESPGTATATSGEVVVAKWETDKLVRGWTLNQGAAGAGNETGDRFGAALAAGNVSGDGRDDLVIGAPGEDIDVSGAARVDAGGLYVFPGGATGFGTAYGKNQGGGSNESGDNYGSALAVGDFDRTGGPDIAVGVPGEVVSFNGTDTRSGSVAVIRGPANGTAGAYRLDMLGTGEAMRNGDRFGTSLATGDVNADGYADVLVGAPGASKGGPANAGVAVLYPGRAGTTEALHPARIVAQGDVVAGNETGDEFGSSVALGDFDGDGRAEGFLGAQGEVVGSNPRAGTGVVVDEILPRPTNRPIEQYAPTAALQSAPVGTETAPIRYAFVDNLGGPKVAIQPDPAVAGTAIWDTTSSLEAVFTGKPAIGQTADGKGVVAVRSTRGEVWIRTQTEARGDAPWGPWVNYGGPDVSAITMATLDNGRPAVIGVGARGELVVLPQAPTGRFGAWQGTGVMSLTGEPVAVTVAGGIRIFARDADGIVHTGLYAGLALSGCGPVGDAAVEGSPSVIVYPGSRLRVFAGTADQRLVTIGQDIDGKFEPSWTTVQTAGAATSPAAVLDPVSGKITVLVRDVGTIVRQTTETLQGSVTFGDWAQSSATEAYTDVTVVPYTASGGASYLVTFRDQNNVQVVLTPQSGDRAALAARGAVRSFTEGALPKVGK